MDTTFGKLDVYRDNFVANWHEHVWSKSENGESILNKQTADSLALAAKDNYMDKIMISLPLTGGPAAPEKCKEANNIVYEAMQMYPDLFCGFCYVDSGFTRESLVEIDRCVKELGMIGLKLYHQYTMDNPVHRPIIEKCIELDIPILMHAGHSLQCSDQPNMSGGEHIAAASKTYPEANFLMAHVTGGGDWLWQLRAIADCANVYTDISGSIIDNGAIEETVKYLGADRVLFGTDGSLTAGVGKLLGANISMQDKTKIVSGNGYRRFIKEGK